MRKTTRAALPLMIALALVMPATVHAFCGFYVAGADDTLVNEATMVVMMREGSRTVLSMQNHYQGPPENFAMVVPVPVVLQEEDVKVLPEAVFDRIDKLASPRLVEYWEMDPCYVEEIVEEEEPMFMEASAEADEEGGTGMRHGVTIEAEFTVGEYEIVILSAEDSTGLDAWLRENEYSIPDGAEPVLRPYVEAGMKFFVAKVDVTKVRFQDGQAKLSPLRFHYDTDTFQLPVRLGLLNAEGKQDLIVHILAPNQRYEMANYENVTIPTNVTVANEVRERFPEFYAALFDETLAQNRRAVVTEYAWQATNCDPCPGPVLDQSDLATLGADVLPSTAPGITGEPGSPGYYEAQSSLMSFVLTRLHTRYDNETLNEDLVFRAASPIVGGREFLQENGELEHGSRSAGQNNFQGRYAIRHEWEGPIECENPVRGRWGGPPGGVQNPGIRPAQDLAFATRGALELPTVVRTDIPELSIDAAVPEEEEADERPASTPTIVGEVEEESGCGSCAVNGSPAPAALLLLGLALMMRRKR
ncbi:MAG: DUF2330 domain-containing protein [Deltaproteobacteria bacterium]|nr:DUF2330 domain-containing protein [Deltaproteobacteria bacterium]